MIKIRKLFCLKQVTVHLPSPGRAQPNNFPTGSTGGRGTPHVNPYIRPPRVVDQVLGAGADPAGVGDGGEAAEFDPVPRKEQSQESKTFDYDYRSKKKKQSAEQCELDENVKEKKLKLFTESIKIMLQFGKHNKQDTQRSLNNLVEQLTSLKKSKSWDRNRKSF